MKLTQKQLEALQEASRDGGRLFQLPERRRHSSNVLASLVKRGFLKAEPVGVIWTLTNEGQAALNGS